MNTLSKQTQKVFNKITNSSERIAISKFKMELEDLTEILMTEQPRKVLNKLIATDIVNLIGGVLNICLSTEQYSSIEIDSTINLIREYCYDRFGGIIMEYIDSTVYFIETYNNYINDADLAGRMESATIEYRQCDFDILRELKDY